MIVFSIIIITVIVMKRITLIIVNCGFSVVKVCATSRKEEQTWDLVKKFSSDLVSIYLSAHYIINTIFVKRQRTSVASINFQWGIKEPKLILC